MLHADKDRQTAEAAHFTRTFEILEGQRTVHQEQRNVTETITDTVGQWVVRCFEFKMLGARFNKQSKIAQERNFQKAQLGEEISAGNW